MGAQGGDSTFFGFVKRCLVYLWVRDLEHNRYIFEVALMEFKYPYGGLLEEQPFCKS